MLFKFCFLELNLGIPINIVTSVPKCYLLIILYSTKKESSYFFDRKPTKTQTRSLYDDRTSNKTIGKCFKIGQAFMNNILKTEIYTFGSGRSKFRYFAYVDTLFGSLLRQNIENQQITSTK